MLTKDKAYEITNSKLLAELCSYIPNTRSVLW